MIYSMIRHGDLTDTVMPDTERRQLGCWLLLLVFSTSLRTSSSSSTGTFQNSGGQSTSPTDVTINCTAAGAPFPLKGRLYSPKSIISDGSNANVIGANSANSGGRGVVVFSGSSDASVQNVTLFDGGDEGCGLINIFGQSEDKKLYVVTGQIEKNNDGLCVKDAAEKSVKAMGERSAQFLLILYANKDIVVTDTTAKSLVDDSTFKDKLVVFLAELPAADTKYFYPNSCTVPIRPSDDDQSQQDSLLNNFSRTSVLFVSVSFIILMVISLAWLVFYYVQRFRYAHAKDRLARRLFNAAKKALTKIPAKTLRQGDKELDSDCPVCIEPYHAGDVIRILPCRHVFHKTCVDPWLLEHRTCPMCKMDILKAFGYHFGHSEESVRDADQLSAGGQSTDGGSGATGAGGRGGSGGQHFPISLPTESDLHDPFFPSPVPSPSLLQPVLHSSNAQSFTIIPLTVHRQHHATGGSTYASARSSDSSADSADNWIPGSAARREHSAEVHHGAAVVDDSRNRTIVNVDDNHNDTKVIQRHPMAMPPPYRRPESAGDRPAVSRSSFSSSSSSSSTSQQQRQPLFHSRSAGMLRDSGTINAADNCDCDDGGMPLVDARKNFATNSKRRRQDDQSKMSAIVSRARSSSQTISPGASKAKVAVCTTPPPTAACQATTTTMVIGRESVSSLSSGSDCVVVGVVNTGRAVPTARSKRGRNEQGNAAESLESL